MTYFSTHELPVLAEIWRADVAGEQADWQVAANAAGIDRNRVPHVLWQLHEAGYIATDLRPPSGAYIPFPMTARVTSKGRTALGEGPDGLAAALEVVRLTIDRAAHDDPDRAGAARRAWVAVSKGAPSINAVVELVVTVARLLSRVPH